MNPPHTALTCTNSPRYLTSMASRQTTDGQFWPVINMPTKRLDCKLDARQRALTSQDRIEIQYHCLPAGYMT